MAWHDHGNPSDAPIFWLDGLDIPVVQFLDASFAEHLDVDEQPITRPLGDSDARYGANLLPGSIHRPGGGSSPVFNYPYARTRDALERMRRMDAWDPCHGLKMRYTNPITGNHAMATMGTFMPHRLDHASFAWRTRTASKRQRVGRAAASSFPVCWVERRKQAFLDTEDGGLDTPQHLHPFQREAQQLHPPVVRAGVAHHPALPFQARHDVTDRRLVEGDQGRQLGRLHVRVFPDRDERRVLDRGQVELAAFLSEQGGGDLKQPGNGAAMQSMLRPTLLVWHPYLASIRIPAKKSANASWPCSGSTCATYWSGRTTTMQPVSRFTPRSSKMSPAFGSAQNIFS